MPAAARAIAYAELAAVGMTSDAYHLVTPSPDPSQAIAAIRQGLAAAEVNPEDVDYVNAHATGTPVGDAIEAKMLQAVFGEHCPRIPVSSTKSMTGHLLSAAAAVEATACLTAMKSGAIPPTMNLDQSRSRMRFVPRGERAARSASARGDFEFVRFRRPQHVAGAQSGGVAAERRTGVRAVAWHRL